MKIKVVKYKPYIHTYKAKKKHLFYSIIRYSVINQFKF